jgi:hypothetical protein
MHVVVLGDLLDESVAPDLDSPGGADGLAAVIEDARMVDVVRPRTDRAEIREDIPDRLRIGGDGATAVDLGHRLKLYDQHALACGFGVVVAEETDCHPHGGVALADVVGRSL